MVEKACPNEIEVELLKQHYHKAPGGLIGQRSHAVLLNSQGYHFLEISKVLFRTEKTVREWIKNWHERRMASIFPEYLDNQNAAKLTKEQKQEIGKVLSRPPSEYSLPKSFWDVSSLKKYIGAEFGVEYESDNSYRFIFKLCNFSFHLPAKFDIHRNEKVIKKRIKEIRKIIKPFLKDPSWVVLTADETRIIWEAIVRRAWLPKGERTVIMVQRKRDYQSFLGFLNLKNGRPHIYKVNRQNTKETIRVLKSIKKNYAKQKICLIWDNASWHHSKELKKNLKTILKPFFLLNLPAYAPDTNPQEHVWKDVKDKISNEQFKNIEELVKVFKSTVMGRNYLYKI